MQQTVLTIFLIISIGFISFSGFAQRALPAEGRIIYQVSHASNNALDARPVIREFHVTYNRNYIREEFIDEPNRFTITDRRTNRKRYAAGYFKDIPIEIEEDVSPQSFHTVESVQLRSIAGYPSQLYIVFVNNRWTDIFIHANETLQYPEILNLEGLAMEYTMPSEYGILNYRVKRVESATFDDEWFTFKPLQRITPSEPAADVVPFEAKTTSGLMGIYEDARSNAYKYIDRLQEVSSLRRMLSPDLQAERYDKTLEEERDLLNKLIEEDQRMRDAVDSYRSLRAPSGLNADDLGFLSEAARARRTVVNVKETTQVDLEKAEAAHQKKLQEQSQIATRPQEPARPDMQWRQSPQEQETRPVRTPRQPQRPVEPPKRERETPTQQEIVQPSTPAQTPVVREQDEIVIALIPEEAPETILPEPLPEANAPERLAEVQTQPEPKIDLTAPETIVPEPLPEANAPERLAEVQTQPQQEMESPAPEAVRTPAVQKTAINEKEEQTSDIAIPDREVRQEKGTPEAALIPAESEPARPQRTQQDPGFVSLMDFVNKQETADAKDAPARAPRRVIAETPALYDVAGKFMNDDVFRLSDFQGKVVVLNFWFIACRPCIIEIPKLNELVADYTQEDVVFLAVGLDGKDRIRDFLVRYPFEYQIVPAAMDIASQFGVSTYPTHIVLDKKGKVLVAENGFTDHVKRQIVNAIDDALGK